MRSYESAPRTPPLPSANWLSFPVFLCVAGPAYGREGGEGACVEPNHTTARKLGPLINRSIPSVYLSHVHFFDGVFLNTMKIILLIKKNKKKILIYSTFGIIVKGKIVHCFFKGIYLWNILLWYEDFLYSSLIWWFSVFFFDMMIFCLACRSEDLPQFPVDSGRYAAVRNAMTNLTFS